MLPLLLLLLRLTVISSAKNHHHHHQSSSSNETVIVLNNGVLTITTQPSFIEYQTNNSHHHHHHHYTVASAVFKFSPPCDDGENATTIFQQHNHDIFFSTSSFDGQSIRIDNLTYEANGHYYAVCGSTNYTTPPSRPLFIGVQPRILAVDVKRGTRRLSETFYNLTRTTRANFQDNFVLSEMIEFAHFNFLTIVIRVLEGVDPGGGKFIFSVPQFKQSGTYGFIHGPDLTSYEMDNIPVKEYSFSLHKQDLIAFSLCHVEGSAIAGFENSSFQDRATFFFEVGYDASISAIIVDRGASKTCSCLFTCKASGCPSEKIASYEWAFYNLDQETEQYDTSVENSDYDYSSSSLAKPSNKNKNKHNYYNAINYLPGNVDRLDQYLLNATDCQELYQNVMHVAKKYTSYRVSCRVTSPGSANSMLSSGKLLTTTNHASLYDLLRPCTVDEFQCTRSKQCIPASKVCDNQIDCTDASDEDRHARNCEPPIIDGKTPHCQYGQFQCASSGDCILMSKRCDFKVDCLDGSDEANCQYEPCGPGQFPCKNGQCIDFENVCDGTAHCLDRSDEADNLCTKCNSSVNNDNDVLDMWRCNVTRKCIHISRLCNQHADCGFGDTSDESAEACRLVFTRKFQRGTACSPGSVKCSTTPICVEVARLCDGIPDCCPDNNRRGKQAAFYGNCEATDEIGCQTGSCSRTTCQHTCLNISITKPHSVCEGRESMERGHYCTCKNGYKRPSNSQRTCIDIDECNSPLANNCSQKCKNRLGTYECYCAEGFTKVPLNLNRQQTEQPAAFTCRANQEKEAYENNGIQLLFIYGDSIRLINERKKTHKILAHTTLGKTFQALDVDIRDGTVIFVEREANRLRRTALPINDGETEQQPPSLALAHYSSRHNQFYYYSQIIDISVDFIGNNLYVADRSHLLGLSRISVSLVDGRYAKILRVNHSAEVTSIAVNPLLSRLYFAIYSETGRIVSLVMTSMDGNVQFDKEIFSRSVADDNSARIGAIVVDFLAEGRLYFSVTSSITSGDNAIYIANSDGSGAERLQFGGHLKVAAAKAFDIFEDNLIGIFSAKTWDDAFFVLKLDKFGRIGESRDSNLTGAVLNNGNGDAPFLRHLRIYHPLKAGFLTPATSPCSTMACSHLCLLTYNNEATCACPQGVDFDTTSNRTRCLTPSVTVKKSLLNSNLLMMRKVPQHPYDCLKNCPPSRGRCVRMTYYSNDDDDDDESTTISDEDDTLFYTCKCFANFFGPNCNYTKTDDNSINMLLETEKPNQEKFNMTTVSNNSTKMTTTTMFPQLLLNEANYNNPHHDETDYLGFFIAIIVLVGIVTCLILALTIAAVFKRVRRVKTDNNNNNDTPPPVTTTPQLLAYIEADSNNNNNNLTNSNTAASVGRLHQQILTVSSNIGNYFTQSRLFGVRGGTDINTNNSTDHPSSSTPDDNNISDCNNGISYIDSYNNISNDNNNNNNNNSDNNQDSKTGTIRLNNLFYTTKSDKKY